METSLVRCFVICWVVLTSIAAVSLVTFRIMLGEGGQPSQFLLLPVIAWILITIITSLTGAFCSCCTSLEDLDLENSDGMNEVDENGNYGADIMDCEPTIREQTKVGEEEERENSLFRANTTSKI